MKKSYVIPAAGLGTRMADFTKGQSKEILYAGKKTVLEYCVEESESTDYDDIIIVSNKDKKDLNKFIKTNLTDIKIVFQDTRKGLGDAVRIGFEHTKADFTAVALPDELCIKYKKLWDKMWNLARSTDSLIIGAKPVPLSQAHLYGVIIGDYAKYDVIKTIHIVEKPDKNMIPSRVAAMGRYIFPKLFFKYLKTDLSEAINNYIDDGHDVYTVEYEDDVFDCGSPSGYKKALRYFDEGAYFAS